MADEDEMAGEPDWPEAPAEDGGEEAPFTIADFHQVAQKQILNAVFAILSETKMDWALVEPFFETAREVCIADIEETAQIRLHHLRADEDGSWVAAEEAYLGISVSDRETGKEWLSSTHWLSELATEGSDPQEVRAIAAALERTVAKLNAWLEDKPDLSLTSGKSSSG